MQLAAAAAISASIHLIASRPFCLLGRISAATSARPATRGRLHRVKYSGTVAKWPVGFFPCYLPPVSGRGKARKSLSVDLKGRLRNLDLPASRALQPLFEALANALHGVDARKSGRAAIIVEVLRNQLPGLEDASAPIEGFRVIDDGIGFTDENLESFQTSDSTFKADLGGRGVGRFTWLKVFEEVLIESTFRTAEGWGCRRFRFSSSGITDFEEPNPTEERHRTTVTLLRPRTEYEANMPRRVETLAHRIAEHSAMSVRASETAKLLIEVVDKNGRVDVTAIVTQYFASASKTEFTLAGRKFTVTHLQLRPHEASVHKVAYLAHRREVLVHRDIPIKQRLTALDGSEFWIHALVESKALDERVSAERDTFHIATEESGLLDEGLTLTALRDAGTKAVMEHFEPVLAPMRLRTLERVRDYVSRDAPEYRHLLSTRADKLATIPADLSDEKLDLELRRISFEFEHALREKGHQLLNSSREVDHETFREFLEETNALGKANLAKYVVHRRTILELFERALKATPSGRYELESAVHQLIFPLQKTSEEVSYEQSNLWMLDERLAYHDYLASDRPLSALEPVEIEGQKRPDLVVFGRPFAFTEDGDRLGPIVIVEFKRPERDDYTDTKNPITQVLGYVKNLQAGTMKDKSGRTINLPPNTPFYCYIACDLTQSLRDQAQFTGMTQSPDAQGYFWFNANLHAYVEIISYEKLLGDAMKRNRVLFDKLGLPK